MSLHSLKLNEVKDTVFLATMLERRVVANPSHMWWSNRVCRTCPCAQQWVWEQTTASNSLSPWCDHVSRQHPAAWQEVLVSAEGYFEMLGKWHRSLAGSLRPSLAAEMLGGSCGQNILAETWGWCVGFADLQTCSCSAGVVEIFYYYYFFCSWKG